VYRTLRPNVVAGVTGPELSRARFLIGGQAYGSGVETP
jgi:hypothetical protein